jgi:hypothetical protein
VSTSLKQVEELAHTLGLDERARRAESLLESLHAPLAEIESAWAEEVERRVAAFDREEFSILDRLSPGS